MHVYASLARTQAVLRNAHPRLKPANPQLRLKQQQLSSRDGNGKCHENIPMLNWLLLKPSPCQQMRNFDQDNQLELFYAITVARSDVNRLLKIYILLYKCIASSFEAAPTVPQSP